MHGWGIKEALETLHLFHFPHGACCCVSPPRLRQGTESSPGHKQCLFPRLVGDWPGMLCSWPPLGCWRLCSVFIRIGGEENLQPEKKQEAHPICLLMSSGKLRPALPKPCTKPLNPAILLQSTTSQQLSRTTVACMCRWLEQVSLATR